jgi:peroxiredoxin
MAALEAGTQAPDFVLPAIDGTQFALREVLSRGPVVLVFFKISCPICQYAAPFLERIYQSYGSRNVTLLGISQNDTAGTQAFIDEYSLTFQVLLDDLDTYPASNAYGLTNVPTILWIGQDGEIELSSVGWDRQQIEAINQRFASAGGNVIQPVFHADEEIPAYRPG